MSYTPPPDVHYEEELEEIDLSDHPSIDEPLADEVVPEKEEKPKEAPQPEPQPAPVKPSTLF